jgi:16S rRNA (uracil1498-N3)-methyltransferase
MLAPLAFQYELHLFALPRLCVLCVLCGEIRADLHKLMPRRYFSSVPIVEQAATLDGAEAHHLLHVQRAARGLRVVLFDGSGAEFDAEVTSTTRFAVQLAVLERREASRELPFELTLGVPLPKGDRQRWLVEKAVELGVTRLVPLQTEGSQETSDRPSDKLSRYVIEASKQCGRNRMMEIAAAQKWEEWLVHSRETADARLLVAHVVGQPLGAIDLTPPRPTLVAIGPESGFTDAEALAAEVAGWQLVTLGPRILRIETAALALAAAIASAAQ